MPPQIKIWEVHMRKSAMLALAALFTLSAVGPALADNNNGNNSNNPPNTATGGGGGGEKHPPASTPGNSPK
jgi:hypothetical protein